MEPVDPRRCGAGKVWEDSCVNRVWMWELPRPPPKALPYPTGESLDLPSGCGRRLTLTSFEFEPVSGLRNLEIYAKQFQVIGLWRAQV